MKYSANSSDNSNALFYEQVQQLTNFYEQWNDCERTVVISALFKRLPFANLKFLIHSIDYHLKQSLTTTPQQLTLSEEAANAVSFLNKLVHKYNSLINFTSSNDNIDVISDQEYNGSESIKSLENDLVSKYTSKEEIVHDLLMYLPLLRPSNDEGKKIYIQFLPILIEDSIKHNLPVELVQQILSYLLIHPAVKNDDKKPLYQWSQKLQEHISMSFTTNSIGSSNFTSFLPSDNISSFMSTTSSMSSASSSSSASSTTWPTTVPQIQTNNNSDLFKSKRDQEFWDLRNYQISQDFCDDLNQQANQTKYPLPIGNNNSASQNSLNNSKSSTILNNAGSSIFDTVNDEHHISFSKNGTDVDFDNDFVDTSKTSSLTVSVPTSNVNDFLTVPNFFNDRYFDIYGYGGSGGALSDGFSDDGNTMKTRRSNSLTTPTASGDLLISSSAENLANLQKPRSFSLSMESSRNALMSSCGSETRLDKLAQLRLNNNSHQLGMGHIAVWLKSLRLHKYLWLFTNMSYEQMLEMTEEYLENLGVTKGARHKLVLCIQKLAERVPQLKQIEKELVDGTRQLKTGLDELTNIVLSPMKPINSVPCDEDVATHVMRVLDCAFQIMQSMKYFSNTDEESVNVFMWVLDKTIHHEAFVQQIARLKEYKYKLQRIKMMFGGSKLYNNGNNNSANCTNSNTNINITKGGNTMKVRWVKGKMNNQSVSDNQKIRKNSMPYYNIQPYQGNTNCGNKSLSFPNFASAQAASLSNFQRSASREKLNQFTLMQQQHHIQFNQQVSQNNGGNGGNTNPLAYQHRNSLNNLMPFAAQQQPFTNRRNSSCGTDRMTISASLQAAIGLHNARSNEKLLSDHVKSSTSSNTLGITSSITPTTTTSDINSRLESLCRQMTEQAIN